MLCFISFSKQWPTLVSNCKTVNRSALASSDCTHCRSLFSDFPHLVSHLTLSFSQPMSLSVIILGPCRVRPISPPVDISWLKATSACQYCLLVFAGVPPASNTADYWRPLIAVLSCCPHSCYLADSFIVYMQMEVGYWTSKTPAPNGKQTIRVARREKVRSAELINTHKRAYYGQCNLIFFLPVTSSEIFIWRLGRKAIRCRSFVAKLKRRHHKIHSNTRHSVSSTL